MATAYFAFHVLKHLELWLSKQLAKLPAQVADKLQDSAPKNIDDFCWISPKVQV